MKTFVKACAYVGLALIVGMLAVRADEDPPVFAPYLGATGSADFDPTNSILEQRELQMTTADDHIGLNDGDDAFIMGNGSDTISTASGSDRIVLGNSSDMAETDRILFNWVSSQDDGKIYIEHADSNHNLTLRNGSGDVVIRLD